MWSDDDDYRDENVTQAELRAFWRSKQEEKQDNARYRITDTQRMRTQFHSRGAHRGRRPGRQMPQDKNAPCTLFIAQLIPRTTEEDLENLFSCFGLISRIFVHRKRDAEDGDTTYGFITFENGNDAIQAIEQLHHSEYKGKRIVVTFSKKPLPPEEVERFRVEKEKHLQGLSEKKHHDEKRMTNFIDTYVRLKSLQPEDSTNLPDLGKLLHDMKRHSNSLVPELQDDDYLLNLHLTEVQKSIVSSLAADFDQNFHLGRGYETDSTEIRRSTNSISPLQKRNPSMADGNNDWNTCVADGIRINSNTNDGVHFTDPESIMRSSMPVGRGRGALAAALGIELPPSVGRGST